MAVPEDESGKSAGEEEWRGKEEYLRAGGLGKRGG